MPFVSSKSLYKGKGMLRSMLESQAAGKVIGWLLFVSWEGQNTTKEEGRLRVDGEIQKGWQKGRKEVVK